ncbi:MAG: D-alanyl-D-alanine carboxypeptidase/D-alanyl-D-alanine-endopeptidase [Paludibacter sp.]|nr:D-alanyl-D-alanine carboxypeptidase/D-alanyl-D-alanine-endopeptidase [Paludibacter sp.]
MCKKFYLLVVLFILTTTVFSENPIDKFVSTPILRNANISIMVRDLKTGKEICSYRPNHATIPASTMKVITTATALEIFGPDFRYETVIAYDGNIGSDGVLNGNLYIVGSGDPTLGSSRMGDRNFLAKWVNAVKAAGIKNINGRVVADDSRFDNEGANPKWTWDDIGNYYAPGIYALAYLDNSLRVTFKSGIAGTTPEIIDIFPKVAGLQIENNLLSSRITFDSAYFYGYPKNLNRSVRGEIPANRPGFAVKAELPNPGLTLALDFHEQLSQNGIQISNPATTLPVTGLSFPVHKARTTNIYSHFSVPLSQIIKETNEKSNNFYAEQLFKSISLSRVAVATNKQSIEIIRNFWGSKGLDVSQLFQNDGSGLSPTNAVSASFLTDLMAYMYQKSKHKEVFFNSLAIAGKTGTIAGILKKTAIEGKVFAKSGTIARVRSYTGYIIQPQQEWAFTIMVNNSNGNSWQTLSRIEDFLVDISKK